MIRRFSLPLGAATLTAALILTPADAHEHGGGGEHHGGEHRGGFHYGGYYYPYHGGAFYGPYRPGLYAPYGFYRPYYPYGGVGSALAFGALGFGLGYGLGANNYGMGGYGLGGYGMGGYGGYRPYMGGGTTVVNPTVVVAPPAAPAAGGIAGAPPQQTPPPPDNAAHLELIVPQNAEVLFDGAATEQIGARREFVSPPLLPAGKQFDYTITVRYTDASGKPVTDKRVIHVRANDWFRVDFTQPAPPEPLPVP